MSYFPGKRKVQGFISITAAGRFVFFESKELLIIVIGKPMPDVPAFAMKIYAATKTVAFYERT